MASGSLANPRARSTSTLAWDPVILPLLKALARMLCPCSLPFSTTAAGFATQRLPPPPASGGRMLLILTALTSTKVCVPCSLNARHAASTS